MAFQSKFYLCMAIAAIAAFSCNTDDTSVIDRFTFNTRNANFGWDTLSSNMVYSESVNLNGIKLKYLSTQWNDPEKYESHPIKIYFADPDDSTNKILMQLTDFVPNSKTGLLINPSISGDLNIIAGQDKFTIFGYGGPTAYRTLDNGNCQVFMKSAELKHSFAIPGNPQFYASVLFEFPRPQRPASYQ
jgi:hypothetical protein